MPKLPVEVAGVDEPKADWSQKINHKKPNKKKTERFDLTLIMWKKEKKKRERDHTKLLFPSQLEK